MEIKFDFSELWTHVQRIGGARIELDWTPVAQLEPIDIELFRGTGGQARGSWRRQRVAEC